MGAGKGTRCASVEQVSASQVRTLSLRSCGCGQAGASTVHQLARCQQLRCAQLSLMLCGIGVGKGACCASIDPVSAPQVGLCFIGITRVWAGRCKQYASVKPVSAPQMTTLGNGITWVWSGRRKHCGKACVSTLGRHMSVGEHGFGLAGATLCMSRPLVRGVGLWEQHKG